MARYVALLRGINVGGKNVVAMPALEALFRAEGLADVTTFIQSGNVLFTAAGPRAALAARLEAALGRALGCSATVVLRSRQQLRRVVASAPAGFGAHPAVYRYDVLFLKEPLSASALLPRLPVTPGVDQVSAGPGVLYFSRLAAEASRSRMSRIVAMPEYRRMTIRNWNTTTRLLELLAGGAGGGAPGPARRRREARAVSTRRRTAAPRPRPTRGRSRGRPAGG